MFSSSSSISSLLLTNVASPRCSSVVFYHFDLISCRLLLRNVLRIFKLSKKNRWGCLVILLVILFPYRVYDFVFLLPVCIGFVYAFSTSKVYGVSHLVVMWLHLLFNGYVSIVQILFARIIYPLFSTIYLFCFLNIWLPFQFPLLCLSKLLDYMSKVTLFEWNMIGKPYIWITVLFIVIIIQYILTKKNRYLFYIFLLIILNHTQNYWFWLARVVYIDVGQGDCTLISLPFHRGNIMIE